MTENYRDQCYHRSFIAQAIHDLRKELKLSQKDLATRAEVDLEQIIKLESAEGYVVGFPTYVMLHMIGDRCGYYLNIKFTKKAKRGR